MALSTVSRPKLIQYLRQKNRKERVVKGYIKQSSTLYSPHDKIISPSAFVYLLLNIYAVVFKNSFLDVNTVCLAIQSVSLKG